MKTKLFRYVLAILLVFMFVFLISCDETSNITDNNEITQSAVEESTTAADANISTTAVTTVVTTSLEVPEKTPVENVAPTIKSVTRQDHRRTVVMWDYEEGYTYKIYRSRTLDGTYYSIGSSDVGSFLDTRTSTQSSYFYKIEKIKIGEKSRKKSSPVEIGFNAQNVTRVHVIMYHKVVSDSDIANGMSFDGYYTIKYDEFVSDLQWLKDNGYNTITSKDLWLYMNGEKQLPKNPVILSFDDGHYSIYKNVYPLLKEYGMKADFNVICENIDIYTDYVNNGGKAISRS